MRIIIYNHVVPCDTSKQTDVQPRITLQLKTHLSQDIWPFVLIAIYKLGYQPKPKVSITCYVHLIFNERINKIGEIIWARETRSCGWIYNRVIGWDPRMATSTSHSESTWQPTSPLRPRSRSRSRSRPKTRSARILEYNLFAIYTCSQYDFPSFWGPYNVLWLRVFLEQMPTNLMASRDVKIFLVPQGNSWNCASGLWHHSSIIPMKSRIWNSMSISWNSQYLSTQ